MRTFRTFLSVVASFFRRRGKANNLPEWGLVPYKFEIDWFARPDYPSDNVTSFSLCELVRVHRYRERKLANGDRVVYPRPSSREQ
jgi:hypothetical protein